MIVPFQADVPMKRWPIANFVLIGLIIIISASMLANKYSMRNSSMILDGWSPIGMVGHMFLHSGAWHLIGNMIFLWVFGNAICAKFGNFYYLLLFLIFGIFAAITHIVLDGDRAIGASGAINGVVGAFLIFYPINSISCFYFWGLGLGTFTVNSIKMILIWFAFDIWGAIGNYDGVGYWAHIGGFIAGAGLATLALKKKWVKVEYYERSIFDVVGKK